MSSSKSCAVSFFLQQIKTIERYMRRLEFHMSKVNTGVCVMTEYFSGLLCFFVFLVSMPDKLSGLSTESAVWFVSCVRCWGCFISIASFTKPLHISGIHTATQEPQRWCIFDLIVSHFEKYDGRVEWGYWPLYLYGKYEASASWGFTLICINWNAGEKQMCPSSGMRSVQSTKAGGLCQAV